MFRTSRDLFSLPAPLLALLPAICWAYPQFTSPSAGASLELPTIEVAWQDSGTQPLISELTAYTLQLMVGGNTKDTMAVLQTFTSDGLFQNTGSSASGNISAGIAGPLTNGFFFQIVSTTDHDTQIINYSDRFSIPGLDGSNSPIHINAVTALHGSTKGPPMHLPGNLHSSASPGPSKTPSSERTKTVTASPTKTAGDSPLTESSKSPGAAPQGTTRLSTGADIGIGVAIGLSGLISIIGAAFYFRRRIRQQKVDSITDIYDPMAKPELPAEDRKRNTRIGFNELVEADHGQPLSEMDSINTKFELEGDTPPIAEASSGRLSISSDAVSTECGTMTSSGSETLAPGSPRSNFF